MKTKINKCGMKGTFTHYYGDYSGKKERLDGGKACGARER
jgi:hypothetical protein